jgi:hypothetical protein
MVAHDRRRSGRSVARDELTVGLDRRVARDMARNDNPWQQVAAMTGIAALAGAGVGAGSALMFAERRATAQDREIESLAHRITTLERLHERVTQLERGAGGAPERRP